MLLVHFSLAPAKCCHKLNSPDSILTCLKIIEDPLETVWDRLEIVASWHFVDGHSESPNDEEGLQHGIQVASGTLIYQSIVSVLGGHLLCLLSITD